MEKFLVIGAGTFQLPLVEKAAESYDVLIAAPEIDSRFDRYISGKLICDVRDKEKILEFAKENGISGVMTDQTDIAVRSVAFVAEEMGLPGIGYETGKLFTDKSLMRKRLTELGIKVLPNRTVSSLGDALGFYREHCGSVILKPVDTQGSRGVYRCDSEEDIEKRFDGSRSFSGTGEVIIEKFATGREFVVEGMALGHEFRNLCIGDTEYFDIPDAFAAKTRIFPTSADQRLRERVLDLNSEIITGFGLRQGITHSEFIMDRDDIYLIETAARGGGVFISSDLIALSTGLDTEAFLTGIATGSLEEMPETGTDLKACGYMAFYLPEGTITGTEGLDYVKELPYVHRNQLDELIKGRKVSGKRDDKTTRLAIIVSGKDRNELLQRMEHIRESLKITITGEDGEKGLIWS